VGRRLVEVEGTANIAYDNTVLIEERRKQEMEELRRSHRREIEEIFGEKVEEIVGRRVDGAVRRAIQRFPMRRDA